MTKKQDWSIIDDQILQLLSSTFLSAVEVSKCLQLPVRTVRYRLAFLERQHKLVRSKKITDARIFVYRTLNRSP